MVVTKPSSLVKESCINILLFRNALSLQVLNLLSAGVHKDWISSFETNVGALDLLLMHIRVDLLDNLPGNVHFLSSHALGSQFLVCEISKDIGAMLS